MEFFKHLGLLGTIIIGLTLFKVISCKPFKEDGEEFNFKKLILGLLGNILVALAISGVYWAGENWGMDLVMIEIASTKLTIQAALDMMLLAAISVYGLKLVKNFAEMLGLGDKVKGFRSVEYILQEDKSEDILG